MKNKKMIMKTKKVGTSILAGLLLVNSITTTSLSAFDWGSAADYGDYGIGNVGKKLYESGDSIGYQMFGNYNFKVNQQRSIPLWNIQPPEASVGCGGLSFKGGFMSLINIDQLGDQLRDAGAALAWGILLGLVTSLPSIKEVFDTINKWARMIQDLLANACNVGKKLGNTIKEQGVNSFLNSAAESATTAASSTKEYFNNAQNTGSDFMDTITNGLASANAWASSPMTPDEKKDSMSSMINALIPGRAGMLMADAVTGAINTYNIKPEDLFSNGVIITDDNYMVGPLGYPKPVNDLRDYNFKMLTAFIIAAYQADGAASKGITSSGISVLNNFAALLKQIKDGSLPQESGKEKLKEIIKNNKHVTASKQYALDYNGVNLTTAIVDWAKCGMRDTDDCANSQAEALFEIGLPQFYMIKQDFVATKPKSIKVVEIADKDAASANTIGDTLWGSYVISTGDFKQIAEKQLACVTRKNIPAGTTCSSLPPITGKDLKDWIYIYSQSSQADQYKVEEALKQKLEEDLKRTFVEYLEYQCYSSTSNATATIDAKVTTINGKKALGQDKPNSEEKTQKIVVKACEKLINDIKKNDFFKLEEDKFRLSDMMKKINENNLERLRINIRK